MFAAEGRDWCCSACKHAEAWDVSSLVIELCCIQLGIEVRGVEHVMQKLSKQQIVSCIVNKLRKVYCDSTGPNNIMCVLCRESSFCGIR